MTSMLPDLGAWRLTKGRRDGNGAYLEVDATATPANEQALPVLGRKFTFDIDYTSGDENRILFRTVWFDAANAWKAQVTSDLKRIPPGTNANIKFNVVLPDSTHPKWLPSLSIPGTGHDIRITRLDVYPTVDPGITYADSGYHEGMGGSMAPVSANSQ